MESIIANLLINNGVSFLVILLILALWLSWKHSLASLKDLADSRDLLLGTDKTKSLLAIIEDVDKRVSSVKESVIFLAERKIDSEEAYKMFTKYEHLEVIGDKLETTLESIRNEMVGLRKENAENRKDVRLIIDRLLIGIERKDYVQ